MGNFVRGDLVAYEWLPRIKSARFCFVVLGPAEPDWMGRPQTSVQMVDFQQVWGLISTISPVAVLSEHLRPIEDYGVQLVRCGSRFAGPTITLDRIGKAKPGLEYFGSEPRFEGTSWDTDLWASIRDDLAEIVQARLAERDRARAA